MVNIAIISVIAIMAVISILVLMAFILIMVFGASGRAQLIIFRRFFTGYMYE